MNIYIYVDLNDNVIFVKPNKTTSVSLFPMAVSSNFNSYLYYYYCYCYYYYYYYLYERNVICKCEDHIFI